MGKAHETPHRFFAARPCAFAHPYIRHYGAAVDAQCPAYFAPSAMIALVSATIADGVA